MVGGGEKIHGTPSSSTKRGEGRKRVPVLESGVSRALEALGGIQERQQKEFVYERRRLGLENLGKKGKRKPSSSNPNKGLRL